MSTLGTARVSFTVDTEQLTAAINKAKNQFSGMSQEAQAQYQQLNAVEKRRIDSLMKQADTLGMTRKEQIAYNATLQKVPVALMDELNNKLAGAGQAATKTAQATNQISDSLKKTTNEARSLKDVLANLGLSAGTLTGVGAAVSAGALFNTFITQTTNAKEEQAQLAAVLASTGNAAGVTQKQLNQMATAMSAIGGGSLFSEGEVTQAQTRLLSYTGIVGKEFPRAMQAIIDTSSRMGMSVTQSAEQVGRALDIPSQGFTSLSRNGFRFKEGTKEILEALEAQGKTVEAQTYLLEAMESAYEGAGKAARDTLGGELKALKDNFNNLFIDIKGADKLQALIADINSALSNEGVKIAAQALLTTIQALVPAATAYLALWGGSKFVAMVAGKVAAGKAAAALARQNMNLAVQEQRRAQALTMLMQNEALAAQGTARQTVASIALAEARMAERQADVAAAAAKTQYAKAAGMAGAVFTALGGWVGVAALAIGVGTTALLSFRSTAEKTREGLIDLKQPLADIVQQFNAMTTAQKNMQMATLQSEYQGFEQQAQDSLKGIEDELASDVNRFLNRARTRDGRGGLASARRKEQELYNSELMKTVLELKNMAVGTDEYNEKLAQLSNLIQSNTRLTEEQKLTLQSFVAGLDNTSIAAGNAAAAILRIVQAMLGLDKVASGVDLSKQLEDFTREFATSAQRSGFAIQDGFKKAHTLFSGDMKSYLIASGHMLAHTIDTYTKKTSGGGKTQSAAERMLDGLSQKHAEINAQMLTDNSKLLSSEKELAKFEQAIADIKSKDILTADQKSILASQEKIRAAMQLNVVAEQELEVKKQQVKLIEEAAKKLEAFKTKGDAVIAQAQNRQELQAEQYKSKLSVLGLGSEAAERVNAQDSIYKEYKKLSDDLIKAKSEAEEAARKAGEAFDPEAFNVISSALSAELDQSLFLLKNYYAELDAKQASWSLGFKEGFSDFAAEAKNTMKLVSEATKGALDGITDALTDLVTTGKADFKDLANSIIKEFARIGIQKTVSGIASSLFGGLFANANGGVYSSPSLSAYSGQIVSSPTLFAFANGGVPRAGVMGEAGPEAILPLSTGPDGKLGVRSSGGGGDVSISNAIYITESGGTVQTQSRGNMQQYNALNNQLTQMVRKIIAGERRQGGILWG